MDQTPPFQLPDDPTDRRSRIPPTGYKEYWYPALPAKDVKRNKPSLLRMLGTDGLTTSLAREVAHLGIRVNCVAPSGSLAEDRVTPRNYGINVAEPELPPEERLRQALALSDLVAASVQPSLGARPGQRCVCACDHRGLRQLARGMEP